MYHWKALNQSPEFLKYKDMRDVKHALKEHMLPQRPQICCRPNIGSTISKGKRVNETCNPSDKQGSTSAHGDRSFTATKTGSWTKNTNIFHNGHWEDISLLLTELQLGIGKFTWIPKKRQKKKKDWAKHLSKTLSDISQTFLYLWKWSYTFIIIFQYCIFLSFPDLDKSTWNVKTPTVLAVFSICFTDLRDSDIEGAVKLAQCVQPVTDLKKAIKKVIISTLVLHQSEGQPHGKLK